MWHSYGVFIERVEAPDSPVGYSINHSAISYVVDSSGKLRLAHLYGMPDDQIAHDLRLLAEETRREHTQTAWERTMTRRFRIVGALLIGLAAAIFAFAVGRPVKVLPRVAPAPPFELVDPWGARSWRREKEPHHPVHLRRRPGRGRDGAGEAFLR